MPSALWKVGNSALASNAPAVPYKFRNGSGSLAILAAILRALRQQICRNGIPITFGFIYGFDLRQTAQAVVAHHKAGSNSSTDQASHCFVCLRVCCAEPPEDKNGGAMRRSGRRGRLFRYLCRWHSRNNSGCLSPRSTSQTLGRLQAALFFYFEDEPGRLSTAKLLSKDEARRIAAKW